MLDDNTLDVGNTFTAEAWLKRSSARKAHELMVKGFQLTVMSGAGAVKMSVDGAPVSVVDVAPFQVIGNTALTLSFGAAGSTSADYDEFAIYPTALSAARVLAHYAAGRSGV